MAWTAVYLSGFELRFSDFNRVNQSWILKMDKKTAVQVQICIKIWKEKDCCFQRKKFDWNFSLSPFNNVHIIQIGNGGPKVKILYDLNFHPDIILISVYFMKKSEITQCFYYMNNETLVFQENRNIIRFNILQMSGLSHEK